jgi:hypothetical protein
LNSLVDAWKNGKPTSKTVRLPNTDANGNPVIRTVRSRTGKLSFGQAFKRLRALGVPDPQARKLLRSAYRRGEQGRAWLNVDEQQTLRQAGLSPKAGRYKSLAFLTPAQAQALGNRLPAGHRVYQAQSKVQDFGDIYVLDETY